MWKIKIIYRQIILVGGFKPSEKYDFVSWDDDIPNTWKVIKFMFQITNQYIYICVYIYIYISSILVGSSIRNHPFGSTTPIYGNPHIHGPWLPHRKRQNPRRVDGKARSHCCSTKSQEKITRLTNY